jgi:hypothetical protein
VNEPGVSDEAFAREVEELREKLARTCVGYRAAVVLTAFDHVHAAAAQHVGVTLPEVVEQLATVWGQLERAKGGG